MNFRTHQRPQLPSVNGPAVQSRHRLRDACEAVVLGQEPSRSPSRVIVAGFDGTPLGEAAVAEAALRAGPTGCVFVVCAYRTPPGFMGWPYFDRRLTDDRSAGREMLEHLWSRRNELPTAELIPELISGRPADAISRVAAARHAHAIVVGAGRARRFRTRPGHVARQLQLTAHVPVIAVPPSPSRKHGAHGPGADVAPTIPDVGTWW